LGSAIAADIEAIGYTVHTLESMYGRQQAMLVSDTQWLTDSAGPGWLVLTKDKRIRRKPLERERIVTTRAKVFCLTSGSLKGDEQRRIVMACLPAIVTASQVDGPFVYTMGRSGIRRLW